MTRLFTYCVVTLSFSLLFSAPVRGDRPYAEIMKRWSQQDERSPPAPGGIVFVGSSSIRRWEQLTRDFADYRVIQRGFGGAHLDHVNEYFATLISPHRPRAIVMWAGTNDLNASLGDGATPAAAAEELLDDFRALRKQTAAELPNTECFYIGIMPTPGRRKNLPAETIVNQTVSQLASEDPKLHYIDLPSAFATLDPPQSEAFRSLFVDSIHLNRKGYEFWTSVIRPAIERILPPDRLVPHESSFANHASVFLDFGLAHGEATATTVRHEDLREHWNRWYASVEETHILAGEHRDNLLDAHRQETGISITITAGFVARLTDHDLETGPQRHAGKKLTNRYAIGRNFVCMSDGKRGGNDDVAGGMRLSGLQPTKTYRLHFSGLQSGDSVAIAEYRVFGQDEKSAYLQSSGKPVDVTSSGATVSQEVAIFESVQPDRFGQIFVDITLLSGDTACVNALGIFPE